jgi:TrmH family RNA methyltransferase
VSDFRAPQSLIEMIRRAAGARGRQITGRYSIEGIRLVERALRAGAPLEAVLVADGLAGSKEPRHRDLLVALRVAGCPITVVPDGLLAELTEGRDLGPILGLVKLPPPISLADLLLTDDGRPLTGDVQLESSESSGDAQVGQPAPQWVPPLFLAAADIIDPGNVGALTRTAHAAGARGLLTAEAADPFHPRATRISRGSIFRLPVIRYETIPAMLADLRRHGVFVVATATGAGTPLPEVMWPARATAVLMGNEAEGLPAEVAAAVDLQVTIPMAAGVDSYSVNAAAAIVLYSARQGRYMEVK